MDQNLMNNMDILKHFHEKCTSLKVWYSLSNLSLLNFHTNNQFDINSNVIEVMMTVDSYNKFFQHNQKNIIDNLSRNDYFYFNPIYFESGSETIIKINLLIKADIKKTERIYSIKNLIRQNIGYYRSKKTMDNVKDVFLKLIFGFFDWFYSPLLWHEVSSHIYEKTHYQGYFIIDSFKHNINRNWLAAVINQTLEVEWSGVKTCILREWDIYLNKKFGYDWKTLPKFEKQKDFSFIYSDYINH